MPIEPGRTDVHINGPLTQISLAFIQDESAFVADKAFPDIPVMKQSDAYFTYPRGEFNRDEMEERAPAAESAGGTYTTGNDTYFARVYAFHRDVPDQVRANQDNPINLDREATIYVTNKALIQREVRWAANFFVAGNPGVTWTFKADGDVAASGAFNPLDNANNKVVYWSTAASTPIEDIREGKRYVGEATGFRPNVMVVGRRVFDVLLDHPDIVGRLDRGQTTGAARVMKQNLAELFELDEILVMDAIQNTAAKGATAVHSFIGGRHALLIYRPPTPGVMTPAAGYTFSWTGLLGGGGTNMGTRIRTMRMDLRDADRVEIESAYAQKLVAADLGYQFDDIVQ